MFQMLGVFAEFERAMIRERVMTGLARVRVEGKQLGRRTGDRENRVKCLRSFGSTGEGRQSLRRLRAQNDT